MQRLLLAMYCSFELNKLEQNQNYNWKKKNKLE